MGRALELHVATRAEINAFPFGQSEHQLLNKGRHILIGLDRALPLLDPKYLFRDLNLEVLLNGRLTREPPAFVGFTTRKEGFFGRQHRTAALFHNALALGTGATAAAGAGEEQVSTRKSLKELASSRNLNRALAIDFDTDVAAGDQPAARCQNHQHQRQNNRGEHAGAVSDCNIHRI